MKLDLYNYDSQISFISAAIDFVPAQYLYAHSTQLQCTKMVKLKLLARSCVPRLATQLVCSHNSYYIVTTHLLLTCSDS